MRAYKSGPAAGHRSARSIPGLAKAADADGRASASRDDRDRNWRRSGRARKGEGETDVGFKPMIALPTAGGKGREGSRRKFFRQGNETVWIDGVLSHDRERLNMRSEDCDRYKIKDNRFPTASELELLFWVRFV